MKSYKQLKEEILSEDGDRYIADEMTMKELKIAINSAKDILEMIECGAMIQRWQLSAIAVASDDLAEICTSLKADKEDWDDEDDGEDEMSYDEYGYPSMYGEEVELDEALAKIDIPKSRYLTIAKMHDAPGPTSGKVTKSPKDTMQYKGARHLNFDKNTNTNIEQTYSHADHGLATIEKHTHKPTGEVKYFMYKKPVNEAATQSPYAIGMASAMKSTGDTPPLKKSTINKAHEIARSVKKNEETELDEVSFGLAKKVRDRAFSNMVRGVGKSVPDPKSDGKTSTYQPPSEDDNKAAAKGQKAAILAMKAMNKAQKKAKFGTYSEADDK